LNAQIDYASNLCLGWAQLRLSTGYTSEGRPLLADVVRNELRRAILSGEFPFGSKRSSWLFSGRPTVLMAWVVHVLRW
jgi:hypothetical protein